MFLAVIFPALLFADVGPATHPCADSTLYRLHESEGDFWVDASWEEASADECDTEESLLFSGSGSTRPPTAFREKQFNRASYSINRNSGGALQSTLRQQAEQARFNHRVEIRNDTLTRRRLGWSDGRWRFLAGDLDDPEMPIWPMGLPRRTLPGGWRKASPKESQVATGSKELPDVGFDLASPRPQGLAIRVMQPLGKVWAARAWNPVETGDEPPWSSAWNLRHASTGVSLSFPWTVSAQVTETRIVRGLIDSLAEQMWSGSVASPNEDFWVVGAVSKNRERNNSGWALATTWHHRFDNSATVDFTARQRDDAWAASWDPAVTDADVQTSLEEENGGGNAGTWGAGEFRLKGHVPLTHARTSVDAETWRAWNPAAGTGREGMRGRFDWSTEDVRFRLTGTRRSARAASGSVSPYRYVEAGTRLMENPGFRLAAFRAWNGSGPTRTGIYAGVEPAWTDLSATSGLRVESNAEDRLSAQGSVGARWVFARGWNLETSGSAPCYPRWESETVRWRMTINYAVTSRYPREDKDPDHDE